MKPFALLISLVVMSVSLNAMSYYERELQEELKKWEQEKKLKESKKNIFSCDEKNSGVAKENSKFQTQAKILVSNTKECEIVSSL